MNRNLLNMNSSKMNPKRSSFMLAGKSKRTFVAAAVLGLSMTSQCLAQSSFELSDSDDWAQTQAPEPGSDEAVMAQASGYLAEGKPDKAHKVLSKWLEANERSRSAQLPQAYYLHGVSQVERGREYKSLFDFETVIRDFPSSPYFLKAVEQEYNIAIDYINGLKRRFLGVRYETARPTGEELLIRIQERVPGSELAENAAMALANHYYKRRELKLAAEMYAIFRENYPNSSMRRQAMLRQIEANIARFKGPRYDGSGLLDAKLLIEQYQREYPGDSIRSGIADGLDAWIDESAAQQVLDTARWYLKVKDPTSAKFYLARLVRRHPATDAADEALGMMREHGWFVDEPEAIEQESDKSEESSK